MMMRRAESRVMSQLIMLHHASAKINGKRELPVRPGPRSVGPAGAQGGARAFNTGLDDHDKEHAAIAQQHDAPPAAPPPPEPPGDNPAPLFAAIRADDVRRLERALSEGASVDSTAAVEAEDGLPPGYSAGAVTALMLAVGLGRNRIARLLLERGADVHARAHHGTTTVHLGADSGNVEMLVALAAAGGDVNAADSGGATLIWIGERRGVNVQAPPR